jgi:hypothetical protein
VTGGDPRKDNRDCPALERISIAKEWFICDGIRSAAVCALKRSSPPSHRTRLITAQLRAIPAEIRQLPGRMNHRGSGVTEDSPAKYAKARPKFFGFAERRLPPCRRSPLRDCEEKIKTALDSANNNLNFAQSSPFPLSFGN